MGRPKGSKNKKYKGEPEKPVEQVEYDEEENLSDDEDAKLEEEEDL